jgi:hypothetical protein
MKDAAEGLSAATSNGAWGVNARLAGMSFKEGAMDEKSELQIYEISRDDFEKLGRSTGEEEFIQTVIELLQGLDETRAKVIHLDPDKLATYTRSIEAAAQRIGLPVIVKTLSNGIAIALETDPDRARNIRQTALTQPPSP